MLVSCSGTIKPKKKSNGNEWLLYHHPFPWQNNGTHTHTHTHTHTPYKAIRIALAPRLTECPGLKDGEENENETFELDRKTLTSASCFANDHTNGEARNRSRPVTVSHQSITVQTQLLRIVSVEPARFSAVQFRPQSTGTDKSKRMTDMLLPNKLR